MEKLWHAVVLIGDHRNGILEDITVVAFDATDAAWGAEDVLAQRYPRQHRHAMFVHPISWHGLLPKGVTPPGFSCDVCHALAVAGKATA